MADTINLALVISAEAEVTHAEDFATRMAQQSFEASQRNSPQKEGSES